MDVAGNAEAASPFTASWRRDGKQLVGVADRGIQDGLDSLPRGAMAVMDFVNVYPLYRHHMLQVCVSLLLNLFRFVLIKLLTALLVNHLTHVYSLALTMYGRILCCGIISLCQSAATSEIAEPVSGYINYPTFTFIQFTPRFTSRPGPLPFPFQSPFLSPFLSPSNSFPSSWGPTLT